MLLVSIAHHIVIALPTIVAETLARKANSKKEEKIFSLLHPRMRRDKYRYCDSSKSDDYTEKKTENMHLANIKKIQKIN